MRMQSYPVITEDYEMGKVTTQIKVQNWDDLTALALGQTTASPRSFEGEALVDTGAVHLYLRKSVIANLGLRPIRSWTSYRMSNRPETRRVFSPVDLEIMGRAWSFQVIELPDELPNVVGQIPLEAMDWVIDMRTHRLTGNPDHGGEWRGDEYTEV
jgi:predicted aspartyl protease